MAVFYNEGETKIRPGVYQRYSNIGGSAVPGAQDGICAIPVQASWGPLGVVVRNSYNELTKNYGSGDYSSGYTVPAAKAMFEGGATTVYTYRLGQGGKKSTLVLKAGEADSVKATAKYEGNFDIKLSLQPKIGSESKKEVNIYAGDSLVETFEFEADRTDEPKHLEEACKNSRYIDLVLVGEAKGELDNVPVISGAFSGGENPVVTNEDYSKAFEALEPFFYNVIAIDVDDDESLSKTMLLKSYLDNAYKYGKLAIAVTGETSGVSFEDRLKHARSLNDEKVVYLGSGWRGISGDFDGVLAICRTAGVIASTPTNSSIVHKAVSGATDVIEPFTYAQYEDAIKNGMLLPSMSGSGSIWYDSGINTLVSPESNQDDGWKKIRRIRTRFELFDRLDRALQPKVGKINCDSDGIADVIQTAMKVLNSMINERKIAAGASFTSDTYSGDSAWFNIIADDIDSLEKIYLHYQFRFSAN